VKLAPLYNHVFYGADASAAAVMAKKYMMDPQGFEAEQHEAQKTLRDLYVRGTDEETAGSSEMSAETGSFISEGSIVITEEAGTRPSDIPVMEILASEVLPYFDW
jgi:hypothetical protein